MMPALHRLAGMLGKVGRSRRAIGAVEFALTAPFLIALYVGSVQLLDAISAYRKVTITARALADLTTQEDQLTPDQASDILDASRQVMTPYSTTDATLVIAEIAVDSAGTPSIAWVCSSQDTPRCAASSADLKIDDVNLPTSLAVKDTHLIFSQIVFHYKPVVGGTLVGPLTFSDHIFMNPRTAPSICLNTGTPTVPNCIGEGTS